MDRNWTIRPATEQDFPDITATETAVGPEPVAECQIREWENFSRTDKECPMEWFVAVEPDGSAHGKFLGWGSWGKAHWLAPDEREVHVAVPPANRGVGVGTYLLEHMEALVKRERPAAIYAWGRGYDHDSLKWAQNRGYAVDRERTEGVLGLAGFDAGRFQADLDRVRLAGIEIRTAWDSEADPYLTGMYRVSVETFRDVPFRSAGASDVSYETWLKEIKESSNRKLFAIALHDGEVVGYTNLWMPQMEGQSAGIEYTGVLKEYRGKGIAFAVKVVATAEGAKAGVKQIRTNNDPDNPAILHLNQRMGFHAVPGPVIFKKSCDKPLYGDHLVPLLPHLPKYSCSRQIAR